MKILSEKRKGSRTGEKLLRVLEISKTTEDINCAELIEVKETGCAIYKTRIHVFKSIER
jgi:hypothetical protein